MNYCSLLWNTLFQNLFAFFQIFFAKWINLSMWSKQIKSLLRNQIYTISLCQQLKDVIPITLRHHHHQSYFCFDHKQLLFCNWFSCQSWFCTYLQFTNDWHSVKINSKQTEIKTIVMSLSALNENQSKDEEIMNLRPPGALRSQALDP